MYSLNVNGKVQKVDAEPEMPLLWVIREVLGLTGTKFGCGMGLCGACTVHIGGKAARSCVTPISAVEGAEIDVLVMNARVSVGDADVGFPTRPFVQPAQRVWNADAASARAAADA